MRKAILSGLLAGIMVFSISTTAFAAEVSIHRVYDGGGEPSKSICNPDHNRPPFDGTYHAKDGSSIVINGAAVTFNGKTYTSTTYDEVEGISLAYGAGGGVMDDFKTAEGIYGSVLMLDVDLTDGYAIHPFLNKSGTGLIVTKLNTDGSFQYSYKDANNDLVVPSAVAYTKDGTTAILTPVQNYKIDTGSKLSVKSGKTYQFKITASSKPSLKCGNGTVFKVTYTGSKGNNYFFKATAVGKVGQSTGFYVNGGKTPCTIGTIVK